mgnify:CR=1 FL=1
MANNIKPYKVHSKRRRNQTLLVQAGLGVLIVALLFGISYSSVKIIHGQPVFPVRGAQQDGGQPSSESTPPAPESVSTPSGGGAQEVGGRPEAAAPVQAWNTEVPVERTLESDVTASDSRLLAVPEYGVFPHGAVHRGFPVPGLCAVCTHAGCGNSMRV